MKLFNIIDTSFKNFDSTIRKYLAKAFNDNGINYGKTQIYNIIFEGIKGVIQNAMFYIEDAFSEQNIDTAYRKESIYSLAKLSGYEPSYGNAAVGTVTAKYIRGSAIPVSYSKIYIRNNSVIYNTTTGLKYIMYLPTDYYVIDISKPLVTFQFKLIQGVWNSATYIATGDVNEAVHVTSTQFDKEYVEVYVNNVKYTQAANMYDMTEDGKEYMVQTGYDNTFDIIFGNGIYGRKLVKGDSVIIRYITHSGTVGNILSPKDNQLAFISTGYNEYGDSINLNNSILLSIDSQISGASNVDSVNTVKTMVGYSSRSLVLANADNFRLFLKRFSFIGQSNIWTESNSLTVNISAISSYINKLNNYIDYFKIEPSELLLSDDQKNMVITTINNSNKVFAGVNVEFKDPIVRQYAIVAYVKVDSEYNKDNAKEAIQNALAQYFTKLESNTKFIAKSDIIKDILNNYSFIKSLDINFISNANEQAYKDGYYYKYEQKLVNGSYQYVPVKYIYNSDTNIGLDVYGNILLDTEMEVPFLHGNFKYYPYKDEKYKLGDTEDITIDTIQYFFL